MKIVLRKTNQNRPTYLTSNWKEYNRQKQAEYRFKKRTSKPASLFQKNKQKQLLKLLINNRSFVPVPQKLKHPIIKNWNADNYWYPKKLDLNNLKRGCTRIYEDNWNQTTIIWLDLDQKGWTKLAKLFRCGYVKSPKGHIRIPVPVEDLQGYKTGALYYQGVKIGDAKLTGEVMLPGNAYYDKEGKFLGYYEYKAWGTFFPLNNRIWKNVGELFSFLEAKIGIEYKTISQHIFTQKIKEKVLIEDETRLLNFSVREPPWLRIENKFSKITNC